MVVKSNYGGKQGAYKSCSGRPDDHTGQSGMVVHGLGCDGVLDLVFDDLAKKLLLPG